MQNVLHDFFKKENIALYATLPLKKCKIRKPYLLSKLEKAQSVLLIAIPYRTTVQTPRLSQYAVAKDYHLYFENLWKKTIPFLKKKYPSYNFFGFHDHSPIDEVDACVKAGMGSLGDNGLLITEQYGSYVFIGEIITDKPFEGQFESKITECFHCQKCKEACPTHGEGCLSAITQKKQDLNEKERLLLCQNDTAWGCDICQTVCPLNQEKDYSPIPFFSENLIYTFNTQSVKNMNEEEWRERAFSWRGKACVLRNLSILEEYEKEKKG